jgi:hypothetical protein
VSQLSRPAHAEKGFLGFWWQILQHVPSTCEASPVLSTCVHTLHLACALVTRQVTRCIYVSAGISIAAKALQHNVHLCS